MDNSKWNKFKEHNAETLTELEALKEELDAENESLEAKASGGADVPEKPADKLGRKIRRLQGAGICSDFHEK